MELNFVKTGLKYKVGVNPQSFSHELCLNEILPDSPHPLLSVVHVTGDTETGSTDLEKAKERSLKMTAQQVSN